MLSDRELQHVRKTVEAMAPAVMQMQQAATALAPFIEQAAAAFRAFESMTIGLEDFGRALQSNWQALQDLFTRYRVSLPANWPDDMVALRAAELGESTGISVVHVPRADIVTELVEAPDFATCEQILTERSTDIMDDCSVSIETIQARELTHLRDALQQVVAALRGGHTASAQCLMAAVISEVVEVHLGHRSFSYSSQRWAHDLDAKEEQSSAEFRLWFVAIAGGRALQHWNPKDPNRKGFNRNACAHHIDSLQFTMPNALSGLLFATSLLRCLEDLAIGESA